MNKIKKRLVRIIGIIGAMACLIVFIHTPSFPTPDKLVIFLTFVFMVFQQATEMLKRLLPFAILILIYESFRSVADKINTHVNYTLAPHMDRLVFSKLPTNYLQDWLWRGHTTWYDVVLYIPYLLFFAIPLALALLVWKTREKYYWQVVTTYMLTFFTAFITFLLFPTAPPWLASQNHYIFPIVRISSHVWASMGIHDFPSLYNHLSANPVAAVPSLHAACSTILAIFVFKLYGKRWGTLSLLYPVMIYVGVVYEGEHYLFDVLCGTAYAFAAYFITPYSMRWFGKLSKQHWPKVSSKIKSMYSSSTKNV